VNKSQIAEARALRERALELKAKSDKLLKEAAEIMRKADEIEGKASRHEDFSQAAARIVREATENH
jgi:hypothetical protein